MRFAILIFLLLNYTTALASEAVNVKVAYAFEYDSGNAETGVIECNPRQTCVFVIDKNYFFSLNLDKRPEIRIWDVRGHAFVGGERSERLVRGKSSSYRFPIQAGHSKRFEFTTGPIVGHLNLVIGPPNN